MTRRVKADAAMFRRMWALTGNPVTNVVIILCWWPIAFVVTLIIWPFPVAARLFARIGAFPFLILRTKRPERY